MDGNILVDEEACVCCQDVVSLTDMVHPKGTDWQGLLGVPPSSAHVCGKCARKLSAKRRTARRRNEQGSLGVSPEESKELQGKCNLWSLQAERPLSK